MDKKNGEVLQVENIFAHIAETNIAYSWWNVI